MLESKVDYCDTTLTPQQLAARAIQEAEESMKRVDLTDENESEADKKKKKSRMKKNHGAGNYKEYRNKTFIKGASRKNKKKGDEEDD